MRYPGGPVYADQGEQLVDQAVSTEHVPPQDRDGYGAAEEARQVERRTIDADTAHGLLQQDRDTERDRQAQGYREADVGHGVRQ